MSSAFNGKDYLHDICNILLRILDPFVNRGDPIPGKGAPLQAIDYSFSTLECWKSLVCNWQRWLQYNPCIWAKYYGNRIEKLCYCVCMSHSYNTRFMEYSWRWWLRFRAHSLLWQGLQYCTKRPHRDHWDKTRVNTMFNLIILFFAISEDDF